MRVHRSTPLKSLTILFAVGTLTLLPLAARATLKFGVVTPNLKVRPADTPATAAFAKLRAARNEFESFQIVFTSDRRQEGVSVAVAGPLQGPDGAVIPATNVTLYRVAYHSITVPSNAEGAPGRWPDPLVPDIDPYVQEKRNAFPFAVPGDESRVVWVDVLVPIDATPGWYEVDLQIEVDGNLVGAVPLQLQVGDFELPSTTTLRSGFTMDYHQPCTAHTGTDTCDEKWNEPAALELRERYMRAALDHRFSIHDPFFQPPTNPASIRHFEAKMLGYLNGTAKTRLPGARLTSIRMDLRPESFADWISYAKKQGFYERLYYWPIDEPTGGEWDKFREFAQAMNAHDSHIPVAMTASLQATDKRGLVDLVDIFVVEIQLMEYVPGYETGYGGNQRPEYDDWLAAKPGRQVWTYQSCTSHGCGSCGDRSTGPLDTGWPSRTIDSIAVANRAHSWLAFILDTSGELYYETTRQLDTAWDDDGQCGFAGHGDGTVFYPGRPDIIGGQTDIPVESIRMKMIRESMEDYEYLALVARKDREQALQIARGLFPHTYEAVQPPEKLEATRDALFDLLVDGAPPPPPPPPKTTTGQWVNNGSDRLGGGGDGTPGDTGTPQVIRGSCAVAASASPSPTAFGLWLLASALVLRLRRRRNSRTRRVAARRQTGL